MRRTIPFFLSGAVVGLAGCVADIPELPDEYQNKAPVIEGASRQDLTEGSVNRIEVAVSDDRDSTSDLTIQWDISQQAANALGLTPDGAAVDVDVPWQSSGQQTARLTLTVTDSDGETTRADIDLTIRKQTFLVAQAEKEQSGQGDLYKVGYPATEPLHLNDSINLQESLEQPTLSPNGQYLAFIRNHSVDGEQLVMMETSGSDEVPVELPEEVGGTIVNVTWSAGSRWLAVVTETDATEPAQHLVLVDSEATATAVTTAPGLNSKAAFRFSDDENHLAWVNATGELIWYDIAEATPTTLYAADETGFAAGVDYRWHPSGSQLAYTAIRGAAGSEHLYLATPDTLTEPAVALSEPYDSHVHALKSMAWSPEGNYLSFTGDLLVDGQFDLFVVDWAAKQEDEMAEAQTRINSALVAEGDVAAYRWSPDESRVAYRADQITDGDVQLFSSTVSGGANRQLTEFGAQSHTLFWDWVSPDSIVVAVSAPNPSVTSPSHQVSVYDVVPDKEKDLSLLTADIYHHDEREKVEDIRLSPDRSKLALQSLVISTQQVNAHVLDFQTQELLQVTDLNTQESDHDYLWSPNSDGLLYLTLNDSGEGLRLIYQPLASLPETESQSLLGDMAPNGRILDYQVAQ